MGASFALSIDRIGAYALDAQKPGWGRSLAMVIIRGSMSVLISGITTERIVPVLLGKDSERVAIEQREEKDAERAKVLPERYNIAGLRANITLADGAASVAQKAVETIPAVIVKMEADARGCARILAARRSALLERGVAEAERNHQLAALMSHCAALETSAQRELRLYRESSQKALADAIAGQSAAHAALATADKLMN
jgi:hypothetical protein